MALISFSPPGSSFRSAPALLVLFFGTLAASAQGLPGSPGDTIADRFLGQENFAASGLNRTERTSLYLPYALALDTHVTPNRLYVHDVVNSRVLG